VEYWLTEGGEKGKKVAEQIGLHNKKREEDSAAPAGCRAACLPILVSVSGQIWRFLGTWPQAGIQAGGPQRAKHRGVGF